jgi:CheY-like chemotaxis protein
MEHHPAVLIVEDEPLLLEAIDKKLKLSDLTTIPCASGQKAIDALKEAKNLPDVIWLDYYLRDMNGLEFMHVLKENEHWAKIPVLVVSNSASPDKIHTMLALGVRRYMLKAEHRLDEMIEIIQELTDESKNADQ